MTMPAAQSTVAPAAVSPLRFITAASLFDGHDAAINIMRRLIQDQGAEVVHLGHDRSVEDVVRAALQEDADAIAISSYQGGHVEYLRYMVDMLAERGAGHVRVFAGGGGTITHQEIAELEAYGVERIYHPDDGMRMGLVEMIADVVARTERAREERPGAGASLGSPAGTVGAVAPAGSTVSVGAAAPAGSVGLEWPVDIDDEAAVGRLLSDLEDGVHDRAELEEMRSAWAAAGAAAPVVGITGTGGAGKSSVIDELLNRFLTTFPKMRIAVLSVDPTRRRTGGALLGDRIRMNSLRSDRVFLRSMATRRRDVATSAVLADSIALLRSAGYDLVVVETAGIGQGDSAVVELVDLPVYVMTSDYGAASQLEKIDMIDYADLVVLNKYDRRGAEDALRDVRKQWRRNRVAFDVDDDEIPVYPTIASQFNDPGITWMFTNLCRLLREVLPDGVERRSVDWRPHLDTSVREPRATVLIPGHRVRYLAEIAEQGRSISASIDRQSEAADRAQACWISLQELGDARLPEQLAPYDPADLTSRAGAVDAGGSDDAGNSGDAGGSATRDVEPEPDRTLLTLRQRYDDAVRSLTAESLELLRAWPERRRAVTEEVGEYQVRGRTLRVENYRPSLSGERVPKVAAPTYRSWGDLLTFLHKENLPGGYPYTGGVYPYRRTGEDPTRMFAGEGTPERTNRRFHYLSDGQDVARLSTAFDSVTLYGEDPAIRPDIYGKVGNSGVNVPTLDAMKKLYSGFDLCSPTTSVSMTINGPAPIILAMFLNTAIDQQVEKYLRADPARWTAAERRLDELFEGRARPTYAGPLPPGNDGLGLALLGVTGDQLVDAETYARISAETLAAVRGTVQADILKEDQAQNTCIFSTEFAMRMMGDIQQYFIDRHVRNFYSVSISGYHIAEAGANPISQLAFTLSNGFTIVEYYLARGMAIDDVAPHLSFFFSNGMDPEYAVIGRVARRIWARAMHERYGAGPRSQMLKYHVQTSGRSLHAQEIQFNDIRTTLQALYAIFDNCNSLHTNAYDEAVTTPTEESVRRAVAIQMIINKELGLNFNENPWQGSFVLEELTDLVEEAVYQEFDAISERGGVLGAMDTMYQRGKIQEESLLYELKKHDGSLPLVGVNTFLPREHAGEIESPIELIRSSEAEKQQQIADVASWQLARNPLAPSGLTDLQQTARDRQNVFTALMEAVKTHSLGQITHALYDVGGQYRRNM
ncbi:methylmalonyl-CoA mutase family protein [Georgenia subflava]|uniref:Fused isobutyryl-CoA mutase n=1 Tax=Georgenia subflava TaxID=1622177 RepID=A0A6N7EM10_9MICO|nr:methylmalonyl-CoA mutase family protein [Georgenia subflava]MPV37565.1 methylmalonyl-CoA mutase [Georgenia subflava]